MGSTATRFWAVLSRRKRDPAIIYALRTCADKGEFVDYELLAACAWVGGDEAQRLIWNLLGEEPKNPAALWAADGLALEDVCALMVKHGILPEMPDQDLVEAASIEFHDPLGDLYSAFLEVLRRSDRALYFHHEYKGNPVGKTLVGALAEKSSRKLPITRSLEAFDYHENTLEVVFECEGKWYQYNVNSECKHDQMPVAVEIANRLLAQFGHKERFIELPDRSMWYAWVFCDPAALARLQEELFLPTEGKGDEYRAKFVEKLERHFGVDRE